MKMRCAKERCKILRYCEVQMMRASDMSKMKKRRRACEARIVSIFLIWTSKLSKLGPKTCQDSHKSATERPKRSTWSPKWCQGSSKRSTWSPKCSQEGSKGHSKCTQGTPKTPKEHPRGSQRATKITENRSWEPSGHPKKNNDPYGVDPKQQLGGLD